MCCLSSRYKNSKRQNFHSNRQFTVASSLFVFLPFLPIYLDNNKLFLISSSTAVTVTIPTGLPVGFSCQFIQTGAGVVTLVGASGVTLNSANGLTSRTTNSAIGLVRSSSGMGYVFGDAIN